MSIETLLPPLLDPLADGRVYPDEAPDLTQTPYVTWQQAGGRPFQYQEGGRADLREARVQFAVWAETRLAANNLMRAIDDVLVGTPVFAESLGELTAVRDETTGLYGARQDFYIRWR